MSYHPDVQSKCAIWSLCSQGTREVCKKHLLFSAPKLRAQYLRTSASASTTSLLETSTTTYSVLKTQAIRSALAAHSTCSALHPNRIKNWVLSLYLTHFRATGLQIRTSVAYYGLVQKNFWTAKRMNWTAKSNLESQKIFGFAKKIGWLKKIG